MSRIDAKDLRSDSLPAAKFPADPHADFRLHISPEVRRGIEQHAKADTSIEICGVLVGNWYTDENGPYAVVTDYIRCDNASSKNAEVTFTHESWAQINKEMDSRFENARIVGWYHSHPDFGIFLSDRDCFIHEHFFSSPGQVAYVIDPVRGLEGMFAWRDGKPTPLPHFWVGNGIRTVEASQRNATAEMAKGSAGAATVQQAASQSPANQSLGFATTVLGMLALFMLGYLYGDWRSRWEQRMMIEGAVAHFADTKLIREGLETDVAGVRSRLTAIVQEFDKLPALDAELSKEQLSQATEQRKLLHDNLLLSAAALERIEQLYGLSDTERAVLAQIAAQKLAELRRLEEAAAQQVSQRSTSAEQPRPDKPTSQNAAAPNTKAATPTTPNEANKSATGNPKK